MYTVQCTKPTGYIFKSTLKRQFGIYISKIRQFSTGWKVYFGPGVYIKNHIQKVKIQAFPK